MGTLTTAATTTTDGSPKDSPHKQLFKVPEVPPRAGRSSTRPRREPARVLEEEAYVAALDHIITRDFFPDLPRLRLQEQLVEAERLDDQPRLLRLRSQLHRMRTASPSPSSTPASHRTPSACPAAPATPSTRDDDGGGETHGARGGEHKDGLPDPAHDSKEEKEGAEEGLSGVGLDGFLRANTSEDNASFAELVEEANARKRAKYRWLYGEEERVRARLAARDDATRQLLLEGPSAVDLLLPPPRPSASLDEAPYRVANGLMYLPSPAPPSPQEELEAARAPPRGLDHGNTRLPRRPLHQSPAAQTQQQPAWAMLDAGEQELLEQRRQLREGGGLKSYDLDALRATPGRGEPPSPKVRGYGFVLTPSPAPHESPIMTWGNVESTPLVMNELDDLPVDLSPGPSFQMPKETHREQVAQRLTEKATQSARKRKRDSTARADPGGLRALLSPSPKRPTTPALSPAAQRLVSQKLGSSSQLSSALLPDRQLRQSYSTPSPLRRPSTPASASLAPSLKLPHRSTPHKPAAASPLVRSSPISASNRPASATVVDSSESQRSLTDNLLNI